MKSTNKIHIVQLLLATVVLSTSGALGKYIAMPSESVVWIRSFIAMIGLFIFCRFSKIDITIKTRKDFIYFVFSGILMALHWVTYFYSLKASSVAIGVLSLFTYPILTSILEPLFLKTKFHKVHILLGVIVLMGLYIMVPEFNIANTNVKGILFGLCSALFYTVRILILKKSIDNYNGSVLMFYQTVVISIVLLPFLFTKGIEGWYNNWQFLLILGLFTTALGHSLIVQSLKYFSATTASIISSVQPVFGITIAFIFLGEKPTSAIFIGGGLIITTALIESLRSHKK